MEHYRNSLYKVVNFDGSCYEVWSLDGTEFIDGYPSKEQAISVTGRLEEENAS